MKNKLSEILNKVTSQIKEDPDFGCFCGLSPEAILEWVQFVADCFNRPGGSISHMDTGICKDQSCDEKSTKCHWAASCSTVGGGGGGFGGVFYGKCIKRTEPEPWTY